MKKIKQWWAELPPSRKEQIYIAIGFLIFGGLSLFLLSELIKQLKPIFTILILIPLFFWDVISEFFRHQKDLARERAKQQAAQMDAIYKELASSVVLPAIHMVWNIKLELESLYYFETFAYGNGFYFQLPRACEGKNDKINLQRKTERILATYLQCPFTDVASKKLVSIHGDVLVIRIS